MRRKICGLAILMTMMLSLTSCMGRGDTTSSPFQVKRTGNEDTVDISQISTQASGQDSSQESTKDSDGRNSSTSEATTEDSGRADDDQRSALHEVYSSYRQILKEKETDIRAINWQTRSYYWNGEFDFSGYGYLEARIAFYDLTGDGIDEMIFLSGKIDEESGYCYMADLDIYGYLDGTVQNLYHIDSLEAQVAGGTRIALFAVEGNRFLLYYSMGDEMWENRYTVSEWYGDGFGTVEELSYFTQPNEDYTAMEESYRKNGIDIDAAEYVSSVQNYAGEVSALLLQDMIDDEVVYSMAESVPDEAVPYDQAISYLDVHLEALNGTPVGNDFFANIAGEYDFSSGVGGWGTYLTVNSDGTFEGSYHDSDMGDMADEYPNGTVYLSTFTGKFKNPVIESNGNYLVELDYLNYDNQGDVEIEDGVRYLYTEPYGIAGTDLFEIYLAGTPLTSLPEEYVDWVSMPRAWGDDKPDNLPFNEIYNVMQQDGFGQ
ncbi:MAG: hypothetical protein IJ648_04905 [Lachnospiraceae bacterium]|nr:hypothetical protein [Lachnospiraceae bacterium]